MNVICVDDEQPALDNFRLTAAELLEIDDVQMFRDGEAAIEWAGNHAVDMAFLDMEMPGIRGTGLAHKLREVDPAIRVVFVTAYSQYAMDAWEADASGYILKPYSAGDLRKALAKCMYRPLPSQRVVIQTVPTLSMTVNGVPVHLGRTKSRELLALLVDRGQRGITTGEGIAYLWPERGNDSNSQSLFRMTYKRLADALEEVGAGHIIASQENRRFIRVDRVDCDLYRILSGDRQAARKYSGQYLEEYSWAEARNGQLYRMLLDEK